MKKIMGRTVLFMMMWVALALVSLQGLQAEALIHSAITGRVVGVNYYHNKEVRFTVERLSWPNSRRYVILKNQTHIYRQGDEAHSVDYASIRKGMLVRAEGGLAASGRIVADKIVILKKQK